MGTRAWMIRRDGNAYEVVQHPYGSDEVEETLYASEWLYMHTSNKTTQKTIIEFISAWADTLSTSTNRYATINERINSLRYRIFTQKFIDGIKTKINSCFVKSTVNELNDEVNNKLNQEFLRARYGGYYNRSRTQSTDMTFRISSTGFNWFNIIYEFVYNNRNIIDYVTIVKDEESTGIVDYFYSHKGYEFNRMPIDDFITLTGNPITEGLKVVIE